jgi:hypothetical protein
MSVTVVKTPKLSINTGWGTFEKTFYWPHPISCESMSKKWQSTCSLPSLCFLVSTWVMTCQLCLLVSRVDGSLETCRYQGMTGWWGIESLVGTEEGADEWQTWGCWVIPRATWSAYDESLIHPIVHLSQTYFSIQIKFTIASSRACLSLPLLSMTFYCGTLSLASNVSLIRNPEKPPHTFSKISSHVGNTLRNILIEYSSQIWNLEHGVSRVQSQVH